jgi:hypothetical protein
LSSGLAQLSLVCRESRFGDLLKFGTVDLAEQSPERLIDKRLGMGSTARRLRFRVS